MQSICRQQFFCCLRAHQYSSDQKKILKDQSAQTTGRVVSIAFVCMCVCVYNIHIYIHICNVYVYIYIYMCLHINKNKCIIHNRQLDQSK